MHPSQDQGTFTASCLVRSLGTPWKGTLITTKPFFPDNRCVHLAVTILDF
jgi:hypothetical protein